MYGRRDNNGFMSWWSKDLGCFSDDLWNCLFFKGVDFKLAFLVNSINSLVDDSLFFDEFLDNLLDILSLLVSSLGNFNNPFDLGSELCNSICNDSDLLLKILNFGSSGPLDDNDLLNIHFLNISLDSLEVMLGDLDLLSDDVILLDQLVSLVLNSGGHDCLPDFDQLFLGVSDFFSSFLDQILSILLLKLELDDLCVNLSFLNLDLFLLYLLLDSDNFDICFSHLQALFSDSSLDLLNLGLVSLSLKLIISLFDN